MPTATRSRTPSSDPTPSGPGEQDGHESTHDGSEKPHGRQHDERPLGGYAGILASYGVLTCGLAVALRRRSLRFRSLTAWNLVLYALAVEHLSRVISKDSVTAPIRMPFTEYQEPAGEGEVNEHAVGHGLRHAVGELLTCPFCLDQWVATGLVAGSIGAPTLTTAVVSVSAVARTADYLHLLYGFLRERVE